MFFFAALDRMLHSPVATTQQETSSTLNKKLGQNAVISTPINAFIDIIVPMHDISETSEQETG